MPFNQESFRLSYTRIMPTRQYFRGYFSESNLMNYTLQFFMADLPVNQLQRLLENEHIKRSDEYVKINSTSIHEQIYSSVGARPISLFGPE